jgi:hypothetical protein
MARTTWRRSVASASSRAGQRGSPQGRRGWRRAGARLGAQERLDLMQVLQVVAHGPLGAVGGAQVALEGAEEPVRRLLIHTPQRNEVR